MTTPRRRHLPKKWGFRPHHTKIHTPAPTARYRLEWERIFGKGAKELAEETVNPDAVDMCAPMKWAAARSVGSKEGGGR